VSSSAAVLPRTRYPWQVSSRRILRSQDCPLPLVKVAPVDIGRQGYRPPDPGRYPFGGPTRQFAEIRLQACQRIGEISLELEKEAARNYHRRESKAEQLAAAGLSTSTAHRYEQLVGESMEIASQAAGRNKPRRFATEAADVYFAPPLGERDQNSCHVIRCHDRGAIRVRSDLDRAGHGSRPVEHDRQETVQAVADSDPRLAEAHQN
jgi:hypothetical protein